MEQLIALLLRHGFPFVFLNVFAEQMGIPIPAMPTLIVSGALITDGRLRFQTVALAAFSAALLADTIWYLIGRAYGYRVLKSLCRISLSPDSCVRQTESFFERFGAPSLLVAKFIPGFSTVANSMAGTARVGFASFLLFDIGGIVLWAGSSLLVGRLFHKAIDRVIGYLESLGGWSLVVIGSLLTLFVLTKWINRRRFYRALRMARIKPDELKGLIEGGQQPAILDVRSQAARKDDPRTIPGAKVFHFSKLDDAVVGMSQESDIILFCT